MRRDNHLVAAADTCGLHRKDQRISAAAESRCSRTADSRGKTVLEFFDFGSTDITVRTDDAPRHLDEFGLMPRQIAARDWQGVFCLLFPCGFLVLSSIDCQ